MSELWTDADPDRLLADYHAVEPRVQAGCRPSYREVMARALGAVGAIEGLDDSGRTRRRARRIIAGLARVRRGPRRPRRGARARVEARRALQHRSRPAGGLGPQPRGAVRPGDHRGRRRLVQARAGPLGDVPGARRHVDAHVHVAASLFHDIAPASGWAFPRSGSTGWARPARSPESPSCETSSGLADTLDDAEATRPRAPWRPRRGRRRARARPGRRRP